MNHNQVQRLLEAQVQAHERLREESGDVILKIAVLIAASLRSGGKILLFGNGGSAADAQHVAAELVGRFTRERQALPAIALTTDSSILTAIGNDYGFDKIFSRQIDALANVQDIVVGISTSGSSTNVINGLKAGRSKGATTIGFSGGSEGNIDDYCDTTFTAPASNTARIQELHISAWHIICDLVEEELSQ